MKGIPLIRPGQQRRIAFLILALTLLVSGAVRLRLADVPLERDEGEYAYAGQSLLRGEPPYRSAYNMKFPGPYYAYAGMLATFGETARGIHLGLALVNGLSIGLVFLIGRRWLGELGGAVAASSFAVLSIDRWIMGVFAHATHFVVLAFLAGLWLLLRERGRGRLLGVAAAGALFGVAVLMKQHAIFMLPTAACCVLVREPGRERRPGRAEWTELIALALGALAPGVVLVAALIREGVFGSFWFWTFEYASHYVGDRPASLFLPELGVGLSLVVVDTLSFWWIAAAGLIALWWTPWSREIRATLTTLALTSFLATCPGFYFREHYFLVMVPALSLLAGVAWASLARGLAPLLSERAGLGLASFVLGAAVVRYGIAERDYLFAMEPDRLSRERYGSDLFVESVGIARYIEERTRPGDRIAVLGSEPQVYFYSGRRSASGYVYMYPLMELHPFASRMQDEMIRQIEEARPEFIVFARVGTSWSIRPRSQKKVMQWGERYVRSCYERVGIVDLRSPGDSRSAFGAEAAAFRASSKQVVSVYRRKPEERCRIGGPAG